MIPKEFMADRFRVVDAKQVARAVEREMNKYSGEGYVPGYFIEDKIIMVKALEELKDGDIVPSPDSFAVPGVMGSA